MTDSYNSGSAFKWRRNIFKGNDKITSVKIMSCVLNKQGDGRGNALAIRICHALKHKSITPKCIYMYVHWHKGKR